MCDDDLFGFEFVKGRDANHFRGGGGRGHGRVLSRVNI
jgi:hypothetical protein